MYSNRLYNSLKIFYCLATVESLFTFFYFIYIPTDTTDALFFRFSRTRAIFILGFVFVSLILLLISASFLLKSRSSERITRLSANLLNTRYLVQVLLIISVLAVVCGFLVLWQWNFAPTDQQIRAYLQRLTPIAVFLTLIFAQAIAVLWVHAFSQNSRDRWYFTLILLGGYVLFLWLLVAEFEIANHFFPEYYIANRYGQELKIHWILVQTAFYFQLPYLLRNQLQIKHNYRWVPAVILILFGFFYIKASMAHAIEVNTDISRSDQGAYVNFIQQITESNFTFTGTRNRTPGYPYILAFFCGSKSNDQAIFMCGKQVNILLSAVLLLMLFWIYRRFFSSSQATLLTLITAFYVFIFKAGYLKAELAFYFASFVCFMLMCLMVVRPSIKLGVVTGISLGITHLIKASLLPGMAIFTLVFLAKEIWLAIRQEDKKEFLPHIKTSLSSLMITMLCFIIVIYPYIRESKQIYGQYFYNINTSIYVWYDSWEEAKRANREIGFEYGTSNIPEDQRPGLKKYLREHSAGQIFERFFDGLQIQLKHIWGQYGVFNYILYFWVVAGLFFLLNLGRGKILLRNYFPLICFAVLYIMVYFVLYAWYHPIAGGPRFITGLFIPLLFSAFIVIKKLSDNKVISIFHHRIELAKLLESINALAFALILSDAYIIVTQILPQGYFGS